MNWGVATNLHTSRDADPGLCGQLDEACNPLLAVLALNNKHAHWLPETKRSSYWRTDLRGAILAYWLANLKTIYYWLANLKMRIKDPIECQIKGDESEYWLMNQKLNSYWQTNLKMRPYWW